MTGTWHAAALRRAVLAVSVIDDIDLTPAEDGIGVEGPRSVYLSWWVIADELGKVDPETGVAHERLRNLLALHRMVAQGADQVRELSGAVRLLALPVDHPLVPGGGWVRQRVLGGALVTGLGVYGLSSESTVPLPWSVVEAAGLAAGQLWEHASAHATAMGHLAVQRLRREPGSNEPGACITARQAVLRPMGGVDVPSLLATSPVRRYLAASDGSGMRAMAVPMRTRGWFDLARIDPAFVQAAWSATDVLERGLPRPVLVTKDEVALAAAGINARKLALEDPAGQVRQITRSIRYQQPGR